MKGAGNMAKLALVTSERNPARAALAEAINCRNELKANVAALGAAQSGAADRLRQARTAAHNAADALTMARNAASMHLANVAVGKGGEAPESMESVRRRVAAAEDDLEIARGAEATLKGRLAEQSTALSFAEQRVEEAAVAVLRQSPAIAALIAEVDALQRALMSKGAALAWLDGKGLVPKANIVAGVVSQCPPVVDTLANLHAAPPHWRGVQRQDSGAASWQGALMALKNDADAPLPS